MHAIQYEISKPSNDDQFEDMCANIYGALFGDPVPNKNGRRGQKQYGVDVFVRPQAGGRVGVQCKRWVDGRLTIDDIRKEVAAADHPNATRITRLIVATTAANDAALLREVQALSDDREDAGKFPVQIDAWDDISRHIRSNNLLQSLYLPNAPGGSIYQLGQDQKVVLEAVRNLHGMGRTDVALPAARDDSVNRLVSGQLDAVNDLLKACRFQEAQDDLLRIGADQSVFDAHQKARWHYQLANCTWHLGEPEDAAGDFLKAAELWPDDDKMASGAARGLLLQHKGEEALLAAKAALERWPTSLSVWLVYANAVMVTDGKLRLHDAPASLRDNADVLQTVAWARFRDGDLTSAVAMSARGAKAEGAGFFVRAAALGFALQKAAGTPSGFTYGAVSLQDLATLRAAVAHFSDRSRSLWAVQAFGAVDEVAAHLAMAYIVLQQLDDADAVINEARVHGRLTPALRRHELDVLQRREQVALAIQRGREGLDVLEVEGLMLLAEIAAHEADVSCVEAVQGQVDQRYPSQEKLNDGLTAMRWLALWRAGRKTDAVQEVKAAELMTSSSPTRVSAGARILLMADEPEAEDLVNHTAALRSDESTEEVNLVVAELLFHAHRFGEAAPLYQPMVHAGQLTELHNRLLCCYIRTGARLKARELLSSLPEGWTENEGTRGLAIELANSAGDFPLLEWLADAELRHAPNSAGSWTFKLSVAFRTTGPLELKALVERLPDDLTGTPRQHALLSQAEFRFGDKRKAMRRVYRMYRQDIESVDAAAAYVVPMLSTGSDLPLMEVELEEVAAGTTVTLRDEQGQSLTVPIDPEDVVVPASSKFWSRQAGEVGPMIGARVGDTVTLPGGLGTERKFTVIGIKSTYRYLFEYGNTVISSGVKGAEYVVSMTMTTRDGQPDFSFIQAQIARMSEHTKTVLEAYRDGPLTLGVVARLLSKNTLEVVGGWSSEWPALQVCVGTVEEVTAAQALLDDPTNVFVVDTATLCELARLNCLKALAALPKVLVSTTTRDTVMTEFDEATTDNSAGRTGEHEGRLAYIAITEKDKAERVAFLQSIVDAIAAHCHVVPAYGPEQPKDELVKAADVLQGEEYAALNLAAERAAVLFTLDGRLRTLAYTLGIRGVWTQPVMRKARLANLLGETQYALANVRQLLSNRTFTSLNAWDISIMCHQGGAWLQHGMRVVKDYLSSIGTDPLGAVATVQEFLRLQVTLPDSWLARGELLSHLSEAIFSRTDLPVDAKASILMVVDEVAQAVVGRKHPYSLMAKIQAAQVRELSRFLAAKVDEGEALAREGGGIRPVNLRVLFCTKTPAMMMAKPAVQGEGGDTDASPGA